MNDQTRELAALLEPVLSGQGYQLVDLNWRPESRGWMLRLFIDRPGASITLTDCEKVSAMVSQRLDEANWHGSSYTLEVSSPGLDRHQV